MASLVKRIDDAVWFLDKKAPGFRPLAGLVLGSGLGELADEVEDARIFPYGDIPGFPESTAIGHAGRLVLGTLVGKPVAVFQGRFHRYEGYSLAETALPVRVLARLGAAALVLTNAAGCINETWQPGELMLIADHFNFSGRNPLAGPNLDAYGPRFPDLTQAYDPALREVARRAGREQGLTLREGVYAYMPGPSFETPAEIRALRVLGADAVGMSTVPETIVAAHCGIRVLGISCLTNMAAGILDAPLGHEEVLATGARAREGFARLLRSVIAGL